MSIDPDVQGLPLSIASQILTKAGYRYTIDWLNQDFNDRSRDPRFSFVVKQWLAAESEFKILLYEQNERRCNDGI